MRGALLICGRELLAASERPLAIVVLGVFVGLLGLLTLWFDDVLLGGVASMRRPFLWMSVCLLFLVPAATMGLLVEERLRHTYLILGSLPFTATAVIGGKWLSAVVMVGSALALTWPWPVMLSIYGELDPGPVLGGYLGLLLAGAALAAVGTAASAAASSQVVAFLLALVVGLLPWLVGFALPLLPASWAPVVQYLTFDYHFSNLARGVIDSRSLVFFASVCALSLRIAVHALERERLS